MIRGTRHKQSLFQFPKKIGCVVSGRGEVMEESSLSCNEHLLVPGERRGWGDNLMLFYQKFRMVPNEIVYSVFLFHIVIFKYLEMTALL